jgi:hypothetical protein
MGKRCAGLGDLGRTTRVVRGFGLGALSGCHVGPPCQSMIGVIFCGLLLWVRFAREGQQPYLLNWAQVVSTKFFQ